MTARPMVLWAVLAAGGWLVVLRGLWFGPTSADPTLDLEAGGAFAANFEVYLPALALTLVFVVVAIASAATRAWGRVALVVSTTTVVFSFWTLSRGYLLDYRPDLAFHLWAGIDTEVVAALLVVLTLSVEPSRGKSLEDRGGSWPVSDADVPRSQPGSGPLD